MRQGVETKSRDSQINTEPLMKSVRPAVTARTAHTSVAGIDAFLEGVFGRSRDQAPMSRRITRTP